MQLHKMHPRKCDEHGCGHYGASRGTRTHNGIDLACAPGTLISCPVEGMITKLGYAYADDLSYRYVQIEVQGYEIRLFYVDPLVSEGDRVHKNDALGACQGLSRRYPGITDHAHLEIKDEHGDYVDPVPFLIGLGWQG